MTRSTLTLVIVAALAVTAGGAAARAQQAPAPAPADCSGSAVRAAAVQAQVVAPGRPADVHAGVCGAFLGPGTDVIGVTLVAQQCDPDFVWTLLQRGADGAYRHVEGPWDDGPRIVGITADGDTLREEQPVFRASDKSCVATGGTRVRTWAWNGTALAPGPFARGAAPDPRPRTFAALRGRVACRMADDHQRRQVACVTRDGGIVLRASGRRAPCACGDLSSAPRRSFPALAAGRHVTVGRFACRVARVSVRCVVAATGKGMTLR